MRIEKDGWLSDVLGVSSWKVLGMTPAESPSDIRAGLLDRVGSSAGFFSAKISTSEVAAVGHATRAGFSVVDVNVTFDWTSDGSAAAGSEQVERGTMTIEDAGEADFAGVEAIAGRCFAFSRFHLDPAVGLDRANEIKRQWARNACRGRASAVYVARRDNHVAGFLAVLESRSGSGTDAIIDLVGVDAPYQGQGLGRALSRTFIAQRRNRADRLRVGTQVSNIPAMRLYESIGFRVAETAYVLHAHVKDGALSV